MEWLKELLESQGVTVTSELMEAVKKTAPEHVVPKAQYNSKAEEAEAIKGQIAERDKDIAELKKGAGANEALAAQLADLQGKYKADTEALTGQLAQAQLDSVLDLALVGAGAKNVKAVRALLDASKIKLDGETLTGLTDQLTVLQASDAYLFSDSAETKKPTGYEYQPRGGSDPEGAAPQTLQQVIGERIASSLKQPG